MTITRPTLGLKPKAADALPSYHVTMTGPVKGHPPITIKVTGRTPKEAVEAAKKVILNGRLTWEPA